jgi:predicted NAD-dependent protein-ADP-ribosyltransferase YbiA (DUF1768 family)
MSLNNAPESDKKIQNSILSFSNQATTAYRWFTKQDFLNMMSEMTMEEIQLDLEKFKSLEEYEICKKIEYVLQEKMNAEMLNVDALMASVDM